MDESVRLADEEVEAVIQKARTIGQLERLAGIETQHDRALFWMQFVHLKNRASEAGKAELKRIIRSSFKSQETSPD